MQVGGNIVRVNHARDALARTGAEPLTAWPVVDDCGMSAQMAPVSLYAAGEVEHRSKVESAQGTTDLGIVAVRVGY